MMNRILSAAVAALLLASASADDLKWVTDLPKAQALASKEDKLVLVNFTGSDWCGFCVKLDREVFSTEKFAEYAKKKLVLVYTCRPVRVSLADNTRAIVVCQVSTAAVLTIVLKMTKLQPRSG